MQNLPVLADPPVKAISDLTPYDGVLWRRVAAYVADLFFAALLTLPLGLFLILGGVATFGLLWAPLPFLWLTVNALYYAFLAGGSKASTWGQRMMGLRLVTDEGQNPMMFQAFLQVFLFYASVLIATPLILLVGLFNAKGRLIHDMLSSVTVKKLG
ncbi:putative Membrane protein [Rhodospirillaceae bacterium LM-1]|nr:putative Membrane protein [Rhodospirillaceae bacterium LM-1]